MTIFLRACIIAALAVTTAHADDPPSNSFVFSASDFPSLANGFKVQTSGEYTVKVWSPAKVGWTIAADDAGFVLTPKVEGQDETPRWTTLGPVALKADGPASIKVSKASFVPMEIIGHYDTERQTTKPSPATVPVPAVMTLSMDPAFTADLSSIRGRIDTVGPVQDARRTHVRTNHEGANFKAPADWESRSRDLRDQLRVTLGLVPTLPKTSLDPQVFGKVERDGYTIEKVTLETLPGMFLGGNLYRPAGNCRRVPAVLCPHGHWDVGRVQPDVQARCIRLAKLGCVVFLYDMVGYNDSKAFQHEFLNDRLDAWGFSLATLQTWNSIRAVDWLATLPDVDPARIACTGESGGGTQTFLLSALDPRIAVSAPVVMVSERFQGGCVCENASGLRHGTDNVEIAALAAPRPMMIVGATGDWSSRTLTKVHPALRGVYERNGTSADIEAALFNFPHNYNQTSRNAVYAFLGRELLGIEDAASTREGEQTPEKPEDLWAFNEKHPAPPEVKSPKALEDHLVKLRDAATDFDSAAGSPPALADAALASLATIHRIRTGIAPARPSALTARKTGESMRSGVAITHWTVADESKAEIVPVVRVVPEKPSGRVSVVFHDRGKAGLFEANGEPTKLVRALLDRGVGVIGFDPLLVGESFDPTSPASRRPRTAHYTTYNRALAVDRMNDLATVAAWAGSLGDVREVSIVGVGGGAPLALLARPMIPNVARTYVDLAGFNYGDGPIPDDLHVPGILQFGGLKTAAALVAPSPLWIARPRKDLAVNSIRGAYDRADAGSALRISDDATKPEDVAKWIDLGE